MWQLFKYQLIGQLVTLHAPLVKPLTTLKSVHSTNAPPDWPWTQLHRVNTLIVC